MPVDMRRRCALATSLSHARGICRGDATRGNWSWGRARHCYGAPARCGAAPACALDRVSDCLSTGGGRRRLGGGRRFGGGPGGATGGGCNANACRSEPSQRRSVPQQNADCCGCALGHRTTLGVPLRHHPRGLRSGHRRAHAAAGGATLGRRRPARRYRAPPQTSAVGGGRRSFDGSEPLPSPPTPPLPRVH